MISQKIRSLHCGMQAGLGFTSLDGREVLLLRDVPFELEQIVARWLSALPPDVQAEYVYKSCALTQAGWSAFVAWMEETLQQAQRRAHRFKR